MVVLILLFILGAAVGSFLNVLIDRIPQAEPVAKGRSHCDACKKGLAWYDLIPLLSWFWLGAKCRYCRAKISRQYPSVEFAGGILFVLGWQFAKKTPISAGQFSANLLNFSVAEVVNTLFVWFIVSALLVIFVTDWKYYIIPDKVLYPTLLATLVYRLAQPGFARSVWSALGAAGFFLALVLITRGKGMGMGDVKYALLMGLLLGFPAIIIGMYITFLTGAAASVILILMGRKSFGEQIPLGPFLVLGTVIARVWGYDLWSFFGRYL